MANSRHKAAARCTACDRALAVWSTPDGDLTPIGSVDGCPCGNASFRLLAAPTERPAPSEESPGF